MRKPDGYTALYDALGVYLNGAFAQTGDKILVLYTDGGDTRSAINRGELLDLLKASDVTVYSIGYLQHQGSGTDEQQQVLTRVAPTTGGLAFFPTSVKDLDEMYEKILREIAGRYSLGYVSSNATMDGSWRDVKIRLANRPELEDAKVRTRAGYYAPYQAERPNPADPGRPRSLIAPRRPPRGCPACGTICDCPPGGNRFPEMSSKYDRFKLVTDFELRGDQAARHRRARRRARARRHGAGAARRHRVGQDLHDGAVHRARQPADAGDGAQQDARRAAVSGVPPLLSRERRRVLRQLLRLLPARGLRPDDRLVHREGSDDQRRDRPHAAVGHALAVRAPRRHHRRRASRASTASARRRRTTG